MLIVVLFNSADSSVAISSAASNVVMSSLSSTMSSLLSPTSQPPVPLSQLAARLSQGPQRPGPAVSPQQLRSLLQRPTSGGGVSSYGGHGGQEQGGGVTQMSSGTPISTTKVWVPGIHA